MPAANHNRLTSPSDGHHAGHGVEHVLSAHHACVKQRNARQRHQQHQGGGGHHPAGGRHSPCPGPQGGACEGRRYGGSLWHALGQRAGAQPVNTTTRPQTPVVDCTHARSLSQFVTSALHEPCQPVATESGLGTPTESHRRPTTGRGNPKCTSRVQPLQSRHSKARFGCAMRGAGDNFLPKPHSKRNEVWNPFRALAIPAPFLAC